MLEQSRADWGSGRASRALRLNTLVLLTIPFCRGKVAGLFMERASFRVSRTFHETRLLSTGSIPFSLLVLRLDFARGGLWHAVRHRQRSRSGWNCVKAEVWSIGQCIMYKRDKMLDSLRGMLPASPLGRHLGG